MSNDQNTQALAAGLALASQLSAGQGITLAAVAPVATAILAATGKAAAVSSPDAVLALALAQAAIDAHAQITAAQTPAQVSDAWAALKSRVQAAEAGWAAAGAVTGA